MRSNGGTPPQGPLHGASSGLSTLASAAGTAGAVAAAASTVRAAPATHTMSIDLSPSDFTNLNAAARVHGAKRPFYRGEGGAAMGAGGAESSCRRRLKYALWGSRRRGRPRRRAHSRPAADIAANRVGTLIRGGAM